MVAGRGISTVGCFILYFVNATLPFVMSSSLGTPASPASYLVTTTLR